MTVPSQFDRPSSAWQSHCLAGDPLPVSNVRALAGADSVDAIEPGTLSVGSTRSFEVPEGTDVVRVIYTAPQSEQQSILAAVE